MTPAAGPFGAAAHVALIALAALGPCPASAQVLAPLCAEVERLRHGEYLHGQTESRLVTTGRRPIDEPAAVGQSLVKGAMARRLTEEFDGTTVRWSGAEVRGPIPCGTFSVFQILVDPMDVKLAGARSPSPRGDR